MGFGLGYAWWSYGLTECWVVRPLRPPGGLAAPARVRLRHATSSGPLGEALPWACVLAALVGRHAAGVRQAPALGFAGAWFFLILAPASSIVPVAFQPMAEHRMYLSLAAVGGGRGRGLLGLAREAAALPWVLCAAMRLGGLRLRAEPAPTAARSRFGATRSCGARPTPARHIALGSALALEGRNAEAAEQFTAALRIDPGDFEARRNLGLALYHMGRSDEALAEYRRIAAPKPDSAPLHFDIAPRAGSGRARGRGGRGVREGAQARPWGRRGAHQPGRSRSSGRAASARPSSSTGSRSDLLPDSAQVHFNLGMALARLGGIERAIAQYQEAVRLRPGYAEARNNLGVLLAETGRVARGDRAVRGGPQDPAGLREGAREPRGAEGAAGGEARGQVGQRRLYFRIAQSARKPSRQPIFLPSA